MRTTDYDKLFFMEFNKMMSELKGMNGDMLLESIPLNEELASRCRVLDFKELRVKGIEDEYFSNLNNSDVLWLDPPPALYRRKYYGKDENGKDKFKTDKNGNLIRDKVAQPSNTAVVVSDYSIGLPYNYKPKEEFVYVDYSEKEVDGVMRRKYIYCIPKKYLYRINKVSVWVTCGITHRFRNSDKFYDGFTIAFTNGSYVNVYITPYNATRKNNFRRLLATFSNIEDAYDLVKDLANYWVSSGAAFNPSACNMDVAQRNGVLNPAYWTYDSVNDIFSEVEEYPLDKDSAPISDKIFETQ